MSGEVLRGSEGVPQAVLCSILCGAVVSVVVLKYGVSSLFQSFLVLVQSLGWIGHLLFFFAFLLTSFPFVLGTYTPLALAAGASYGVWLGTLSVSVSSTVGACISFYACRFSLRAYVDEQLKSRREFRYFLRLLKTKNSKVVAVLARCSPIPFGTPFCLPFEESHNLPSFLPLGLQNGFFAVGIFPLYFSPFLLITDISPKDYVGSTWLGLLPFQVLWTYMGTTLRNISKITTGEVEFTFWQQLSLLVQCVVVFILVIYFWLMSRNINQEENSDTEEETV